MAVDPLAVPSKGWSKKRAHHTCCCGACTPFVLLTSLPGLGRAGNRGAASCRHESITLYAAALHRHESSSPLAAGGSRATRISRELIQLPAPRLASAITRFEGSYDMPSATPCGARSHSRSAGLCRTSSDRSRQVAGEEVGTRRGPPLCCQRGRLLVSPAFEAKSGV